MDACVVMPNHIHCIISLGNYGFENGIAQVGNHGNGNGNENVGMGMGMGIVEKIHEFSLPIIDEMNEVLAA